MRTDRIEKTINSMRQHNIDQVVISNPSTTFYLTGKFVVPGARLLALCLDIQGVCTFFINSLQTGYVPLAEGAETVWYTDSDDSTQTLAKKIHTGGTVGIDKNWPSSFLLHLMAVADAKYVLNSGIIDHICMAKDDGEIQLMRETQAVNEEVISEMFQYVSPELTEQKHHRMLHEMCCAYGMDDYNIIGMITYGKSYGYVHHKPDGTTPVAGDYIMIDTGARLNDYRSDMTRTVFYKSVSDEMRNIHEVVKEAQLIAMDAIKLGIRFCNIDRIGRDTITKYGCGGYSTHRIGYNIGIDGHESPDVGGANTTKVLPNMTFSVEPGTYVPNLGGVRIEDLVVVTENGYKYPNKMSKGLRIT